MRALIAIALLGLSNAAFAAADATDELVIDTPLTNSKFYAKPHGTWLLDVTFPPEAGVPGFKEMITFHRGGTLSESNTTLHANSANPFFNFNGSDGHGSWKRVRGNKISFRFVKLVFDGDSNEHIGFLRVSSVVSIRRGLLTQDPDDSLTELILGPDIDTGFVQPFGGADATGIKIAKAP